MVRAGGGLTPLAVAAVFVVVIGTMWAGLAYSRGDLADTEPSTEPERDIRAGVWTHVDAARVEQGRDPARREAAVRVGATETARQLSETAFFGSERAAAANESLPNGRPLCGQAAAKYTVTDPRWNVSGGEPAPDDVVDAVAEATADLLVGGSEVAAVPNDHIHGLGVVVAGEKVYAVYRYCNLGY